MTEVSLKEYLERLLDDSNRKHELRFNLSDLAISKAERTINQRLNSMNEFREALKDQANKMATRIELESLSKQFSEIKEAKAYLDGRLVVIAAVVSMIISWFIVHFGR